MAALLTKDRIETDRLLLRRWQESDLAPFAALNADPVVMEFFPARLNRAESDAFAAKAEASFAETGMGLFAVEVRDTGQFIGLIGLHHVLGDGYHFAPAIEVGWRLAREAWGNGFATEGAKACLELAFGVHGLDEVVSMTAVVNLRSRQVMERIGMKRDPADDFEHPSVPEASHLRAHVLYRIRR